MHNGKIAIRTPAGNYRIPADRIGEWRFGGGKFFSDFYGDIADRIGALEDCRSFEEVNKVRRSFGLPEIKK